MTNDNHSSRSATGRNGPPLHAARTLAAESDRPLLLFFTAEWCVPCRVMKREAFADREVMQAIHASVVPVMLYAGEPGTDAVFARYQMGGTPVTIFTDPAGTVLDYEVGRFRLASLRAGQRSPGRLSWPSGRADRSAPVPAPEAPTKAAACATGSACSTASWSPSC